MKQELCIMKDNPPLWRNYRFSQSQYECHRHEVFFGVRNRQKSINDGLVVFLTPEMHNGSNKGVHFNKEFREYMQKEGQKAWMKYYNKSIDDFRKAYGKNYL